MSSSFSIYIMVKVLQNHLNPPRAVTVVQHGLQRHRIEGVAQEYSSANPDADEVEIMGEKTREERDAELQTEAVALDGSESIDHGY